MGDTVELIVTDVPEEMRQRLIEEARTRGTSVNDVASRLLCDAFGVELERNARSYYRPQAAKPRVVFRVPRALRSTIRVKAAMDGVTMGGLVKSTLADALHMDPIQARRR